MSAAKAWSSEPHTRVFEFPDNEFCNRYVNLLFLYGICALSPPFPSAAITSPNALKLLLIACVSFSLSRSFAAPLELRRSLPARSTKFSEPEHDSPVWVLWPVTRRVKTLCDREERSFMSVAATVRRFCARWRRAWTWEGELSGTSAWARKRQVSRWLRK